MALDFRTIAGKGGVMVERDFTSYREAFRTDGVVCLRNAIDSGSLRMAEEAYNWSLAHPGSGASNFSQPDSSATFYQDLANPNAIGAYRRMLDESPAADLAAALWDTRNVWFMYEQVFLKEGGQSRPTLWHQDSSYLPIGGDMPRPVSGVSVRSDEVLRNHSPKSFGP
jgi:hypothetical protein